MPLRHRFETLLLYDPNRSPATANVWISHPSASEEQGLGKLVVLASIGGNDRVHLDIINLIQEELRSGYYQAVDTNPERAFKQALQQTNHRLHEVITDGVGQWLAEANIMLAAIWRDQLIFSSVGTIHAYLLRQGRIHDIAGQAEASRVNPVRIFSDVTAGLLEPHDQVLMCTTSLLDYFSLEKLRRSLLDEDPSATVHQWETTLLGVEQQSSFAAVIIQSASTETTIAPASRPVVQSTIHQSAPQASMDQLIAKEEATERLLTPSIWPAIRDVIGQLTMAISQFFRRVIFRRPVRRSMPLGSTRAALRTSTQSSLFVSTLWNRFLGMLARLTGYLRLIRLPQRSRPEPPPQMTMAPVLRRRWRFHFGTLVRWFQGLTARRQLLLVVSIVLVFVLAITSLPKSTPRATTTASGRVETMREHIAQTQAALLYGGEEIALQHVDQAQAIIDAMPNRSSKDKTTRQTMQTELDAVAIKLAHRTELQNPAVRAQLNTVAPLAQPRQLYLVGTKLLAVDPDRGQFVTLSSTKGDPALLADSGLDTGRLMTGAVVGTSSVIFVTDRRGFVELDLSKESWKPLDSAWPTSSPNIQSLAAYQGRLYALDTGGSNIVRFGRSTNTLGTGVAWLKETANLSQARALAVDGSIYVLQPGGAVDVYASGRRTSFSLAAMTPKLSNPTRLWTDVSSKYLYFVEPDNHRIVVMTKAGKLVDQYTSTSWAGLSDVAINEKTKAAFVLAGTTVFTFTLLH